MAYGNGPKSEVPEGDAVVRQLPPAAGSRQQPVQRMFNRAEGRVCSNCVRVMGQNQSSRAASEKGKQRKKGQGKTPTATSIPQITE